VFGTDPISELNLQLFSIQPVPDKGKGLVARFNIGKGKRILSEKPLITTSNLSSISLMESDIAAKLKALSKTEQRQFLSLHNNFPGKHPFSGIVKTNALPCGPDAAIGGVYPTICLINHSCLPNAHNSWNSDAKCETIHAIRFIKAGEEITISYDKGGVYDSRRVYLKTAFGFDCNCSLCILPPADLQASDARRRQIQLLDEAIGDPERMMKSLEESLADCHSLLRILEAEYKGSAGVLIARLYYDAFQISISHGDQARAGAFAERGFRTRVMCEGEDSPETQRIKSLRDSPARHSNFGKSNRWKTAKELVPKGLDTDEFEKWLWRQGR
jgi:SET domain